MMFFIIVSIVCFLLTFLLSKYQNQLHEHYKKQWKKTVNYIRYTSFAILLAGLLYVPEAQILKISSWLLIFSMLLYFGSLFIIYNKNKSKK